jgi:hypothetical protein
MQALSRKRGRRGLGQDSGANARGVYPAVVAGAWVEDQDTAAYMGTDDGEGSELRCRQPEVGGARERAWTASNDAIRSIGQRCFPAERQQAPLLKPRAT